MASVDLSSEALPISVLDRSRVTENGHGDLDIASLAVRPPMGWNSWDAFGVSVTEDEIRKNAEFVAERLAECGWEYVVVDLGWFSPSATVDCYKRRGLEQLIDEHGRLIPDPVKFPSSAGGAGFGPLADFVHGLGLKFGIHIMRGIPWQASARDTPVLGSHETAADISQPLDGCPWYGNMDGVNMTREGGWAYYESLASLYASWGVDFIKADDMNSWDGEGLYSPYHTDEIEGLRRGIDLTGRPMVLSLSPGAAEVTNSAHLRRHANMWRISADFWDDWESLKAQFPRAAKWAPYQTTGHWPDADMLPLGKIGIRGEIGSARDSNFSHDERITLMSLWAIMRSPLMVGGHLPQTPADTIDLLVNRDVIDVNQNGSGPREISADYDGIVVWASDAGNSDDRNIGIFNLSDDHREVAIDLVDCGVSGATTAVNLWSGTPVDCAGDRLSVNLAPHASGLYRLVRAV